MQPIDRLLDRLTTLLREKKLRIATAESCTGGKVASLLTQLPGSSNWFERGFVTYSNLSKQEMLAVNQELIEAEGAVSEQVAQAMARGALTLSRADVSLAITGIAGPSGGSLLKPVGTVCFAWAIRSSNHCLSFTGCFENKTREEVRDLSCVRGFEGMIELLDTAEIR